MNLTDLLDMGNEMARPYLLPQLSDEVFILNPSDAPHKLLARAHQCLDRSLRKGLPPIVSLRLMTYRKPAPGGPLGWITVRGHFVTITRIPCELVDTPIPSRFPRSTPGVPSAPKASSACPPPTTLRSVSKHHSPP